MLQPKSKIQMEPKTGVTFDDVAGCDASEPASGKARRGFSVGFRSFLLKIASGAVF